MKLLAVTANIHVIDGRTRGTPLRLLLNFDDGSALRLMVGSDGQEMLIDDLPLEAPFDTGRYGRVIVEDVTELMDGDLRGVTVGDVRAIRLGDTRVGVRLVLGNHDAYCIWVDGDEMWWGDGQALNTHIWPDDQAPSTGEPIEI